MTRKPLSSPAIPPAGGGVDRLAVGGDAAPIAPAVVGAVPDHLVALEVEATHALVGGAEVEALGGGGAGHPAHALPHVRDVDAPHELVAVIDVEDEDAGARLALALGAVGGGAVEVAADLGVGLGSKPERTATCAQDEGEAAQRPETSEMSEDGFHGTVRGYGSGGSGVSADREERRRVERARRGNPSTGLSGLGRRKS